MKKQRCIIPRLFLLTLLSLTLFLPAKSINAATITDVDDNKVKKMSAYTLNAYTEKEMKKAEKKPAMWKLPRKMKLSL